MGIFSSILTNTILIFINQTLITSLSIRPFISYFWIFILKFDQLNAKHLMVVLTGLQCNVLISWDGNVFQGLAVSRKDIPGILRWQKQPSGCTTATSIGRVKTVAHVVVDRR